MSLTTLKKDICWVGAIDWDLRNFHGYSTPYGSTYNAYLILDEKPTLIDTVKDYGYEEMLGRIKEVIHPSKIQYIVSNHAEMDHSGSIARLLELCPDAEVVCSAKGQEGLKRHFKKEWRFKTVKTGDTLSIGKKTLEFYLTPMVHWPDSMMTYLKDDLVLFSNDAFGQHYACPERFVEEAGADVVFREAAKYYANIVLPYGAAVTEALGALQSLDFDTICPAHGLIWRQKQHVDTIVELYYKWAHYESEEQAVIVYDTMWHSTQRMAQKLFELLDKEGVSVRLHNLQNTHISDVMADILFSKVVLIGSPMLNNRILPSVGGFLTYLKGLKPKQRYFVTFGSYGWAKAGFGELESGLKEAGMEQLTEGKYVNYIPDQQELESLKDIATKVKEALG